MSLDLNPVSVSDYRESARRRLPTQLFDYLDGGSYAEKTLADNVDAFARLKLRQRVLRDVGNIDTRAEIFGETWTIPAALAPVGFAGMFAQRGEVQAAKAAESFGIPFTLSTVGICSIEEVGAATKKPFWFQLYVIKDRGYARELMQRAQKAGCTALVFTVDLAVLGSRYRDIRNGMNTSMSIGKRLKVAADFARRVHWIRHVALGGRPLDFGNLREAVPNAKGFAEFGAWVAKNLDPSMTWQDLEWVRENWPGKIIIKGVMDADDARMAMQTLSPDGIVVSNHGGRQLDSTPATIEALPAIRDEVGGRTTLFLDGGVRSGLDVVKALAQGADACLLGRAWAYALAARGEQGVSAMLATMRGEMNVAMALTGFTKTHQIDGSAIA
ncbi:L-lactate dehydrogenase [Parvibaculum sp.]|uniref:L-lactate dehydrogenase n=1 Tax=Parvibaculum sp. TaxID=2024848 RepID=UPI0039199386